MIAFGPSNKLLESSGNSSTIASPRAAFWRLCTPCLLYVAVRPTFSEVISREWRSIKTSTADSTDGKVYVHGSKPVEEEVVWICCKHIVDPVKIYQMT